MAVMRYSSDNFNPTFRQQLKALSEHKLLKRKSSAAEMPKSLLFQKQNKTDKTKKKLS